MHTILKTADGRLDQQDLVKLQALRDRLAVGGAKILIHFHGGLVSEAKAVLIAERLAGAGDHAFNAPGEWEQIYVVWRSGWLETLRINWTDLAHNDRLYKAVFDKLIGFLSSKLGSSDGSGRSVGAIKGLTPAEIAARRRSGSDAPFADLDVLIEGDDGGRGVDVTDQSDEQLEEELAFALRFDGAFTAAVEDIDATLNPPAEGRGGTNGQGDPVAGAASLSRLDPAIVAELEADVPAALGRGIFSSAALLKTVIKHVVKIAARVIKRYRQGRQHGLHATIVEELLRALYGDRIGAAIWGMMKQDGADHVADGGLGAALCDILCEAPGHRVMVTGHSAGTILATALLRKLATKPSSPHVDVVFLAAAVRVQSFTQMLAEASPRIGRFRAFAMLDAVERKDAVLGPGTGLIYPASLLYLVSGLFEKTDGKAAVDAPLLGLHRFVVGPTSPDWLDEADERAALDAALAFIAERPGSTVYAVIDNAGEGLNSSAIHHGDFDLDPPTLRSVATFFA